MNARRSQERGEAIRVRGTVQGVGFRPTVARIARELGLTGFVRNDAEGVLIGLGGQLEQRDRFVERLHAELPPLALVTALERDPLDIDADDFIIEASTVAPPRTAVAPDAAMCPACAADIRDPLGRRYRYPFTTCTHCGPRFSIVTGIPYDRASTTMADFPLCADCAREYGDESDRRYHAQPIACHGCGPRVSLVRTDGSAISYASYSMMDPVDAGATLIHRGHLFALKGLGGFQLLCDATNNQAVARLRAAKRRPFKPLALMVRDLEVARRFVHVSDAAERVLTSPAGPIVLLPLREDGERLPDSIAPGRRELGIMLPTTPLHSLMMIRVKHPVVCTSGNRTDEPMALTTDQARERLLELAPFMLTHDRPIHSRVDDSVVQLLDGEPQVIRRARGYAPAPLPLPPGLEHAPPLTALGGQYKATVCLVQDGQAVLSQHLGDLDDPLAFEAWQHSLDLLHTLYEHRPQAIAVDQHPGYRATGVGRGLAAARSLPLIEVQHHHAHIAACMVEHGWPVDAGPVLGLALDGLGYGADGSLWGGEVLRVDYTTAERLGTLKPVALLGGDAASRQPWRNLYAHLRAEMGWGELMLNHREVGVVQDLRARPHALLDQLLEAGTQAPLASSAGRLFDAVAAALGLFPEHIDDEGQAAQALQALVTDDALAAARAEDLYPIPIPSLREGPGQGLPYLEWVWMWRAILGDLQVDTPPARIAARFHVALADALTRLVLRVRRADEPVSTVVLSGGVWQNTLLTSLTRDALVEHGFDVLLHRRTPPNDGCIALGQAAIAAARLLAR